MKFLLRKGELLGKSEGGARESSNTNQYFTLVVIMVYQVCFKIGEFLCKLQMFDIKKYKTLYNMITYFFYI